MGVGLRHLAAQLPRHSLRAVRSVLLLQTKTPFVATFGQGRHRNSGGCPIARGALPGYDDAKGGRFHQVAASLIAHPSAIGECCLQPHTQLQHEMGSFFANYVAPSTHGGNVHKTRISKRERGTSAVSKKAGHCREDCAFTVGSAELGALGPRILRRVGKRIDKTQCR
jgi:hypothetical protein